MHIDLPTFLKRADAVAAEYEDMTCERQADGRYLINGDYHIVPEQLRCGCKSDTFAGQKSPCKHLLFYFLSEYTDRREILKQEEL